MATSGSTSVTVTAYDTLKFSWWRNSYSTSGNYTDIGWKIDLIATNYGRISSTASKSWSVTVNGTSYSGTTTIGIANNSTKTLVSGTTRICHNADGTKTFSYSFSQEIAITFSGSYIGTKSGSGSATLDSIPRYLAITKFDVSSSLETISVAWGTDVARDYTQYSLNNGAWTDAGDTVASGNKSGTFTIKGLSPNTTYTVKIRLKRTDSQLWTESSIKSITTKNIATLSSAPDFNFGDSPTVTINNPSGATKNLRIECGGTVLTRTNVSNSVTLAITDSEWDAFYKKLGSNNSVSVRYVVDTIGSKTYYNYCNKTLTLKGNQKTIKRNINGSWKRGKVWINVSGTWKRAVVWIKINGTWRRSI